jgi:lysophospholipase L1-like esterase
MRIVRAALLAAVGLSGFGCSKLGFGDGSPTSPSGPPPKGSPIVYTAVGASDVIGFGSSKPCLVPFEDCNGNGYVWVAAREWRSQGYTVTVVNRGWAGAVISRSFQDLGTQTGHQILGNITDQSAPFVATDSTVVSLFAGVNDVNTITAAVGSLPISNNPGVYIDSKADTFLIDYKAVIGIIRNRAPSARIILLNVPNVGAIPSLASASLAQKQAAQRASVRMTNGINALVNGTGAAGDVTVVDLMCEARLYQPSVFAPDGLHPNDSGYAILGAEVAKALTSTSYPAPRFSCPQMTLF